MRKSLKALTHVGPIQQQSGEEPTKILLQMSSKDILKMGAEYLGKLIDTMRKALQHDSELPRREFDQENGARAATVAIIWKLCAAEELLADAEASTPVAQPAPSNLFGNILPGAPPPMVRPRDGTNHSELPAKRSKVVSIGRVPVGTKY